MDLSLKDGPSSDLPVRGHGFGLIGVQVILQEMNGRLMLESLEGQGAKFTITLPC
jgi:signal transduction histidine kinase